MALIPLQKFREIEYPLTPRSTMQLWAEQAYYKNFGPLAGRIQRNGGRWYISISEDNVVSAIKEKIKELMK